MVFRILVLGVALTLPLAIFGQNSSSSQQQTNQQQLSNSDKMFLKALVQEDISEINLAKMALAKSSNPQVQQYAKTKILQADPQMQQGPETIARGHGVELPAAPNARQDKIHDQLSNKQGKLFDNAYMNYEASQQKADLRLVNMEAKTTSNSEMKSYVSREQKPVEEALAAAKGISAKISYDLRSFRQQEGAQHHR